MTYVALFLTVFFSFCGSTTGFLRVCYHTNWSQYRPGVGKFFPDDIDPSLCTHIIYAFAKLNGNHLHPFEWNDDSTDWSKGMYERLNELKQRNPNLKTLLAVGGWNLASAPFTAMVRTQASRHDFATFAVPFLRKRNFDGLDFDWEYPALRGSPPEDRDRFTALVREVREVFEQDARDTGRQRLLLTAAVAAGKDKIDVSYDVPEISKYLDFINLMSYDLHGSWESITGHNSPLYSRSGETGDDRYLNVDWAARYWVQEGCPKEKLVIGLGMYGRSFQLQSTSDTGVGAPARGIGRAGTYTREGGFVSYYEVCHMLSNGGVKHMIDEQKVPYVVQGDQWVGYDDPQSLQIKLQYIIDNHYGGFMVWALDLDDFSNQCGYGQYPLLKTLNQAIALPSDAPTTSTTAGTVPSGTGTGTPGSTSSTTTTTTTTTRPISTPRYTGPTTTPSGQLCIVGQDGYVPSHTSCREYIMCSNGVAYKFVCDSRLVFNPNTNVCDWPANYACTVGSAPSTTSAPTTTTIKFTPTTTSRLTPTTTSTTTTSTTPIPTTTSTTTTTNTPTPTPVPTATPKPSIPTTTTSTTDYENYCKTRSAGFYADPRDCHYFFHCANNRTFREMCGAGTAYKNSALGCVYENDVVACRNRK